MNINLVWFSQSYTRTKICFHFIDDNNYNNNNDNNNIISIIIIIIVIVIVIVIVSVIVIVIVIIIIIIIIVIIIIIIISIIIIVIIIINDSEYKKWFAYLWNLNFLPTKGYWALPCGAVTGHQLFDTMWCNRRWSFDMHDQ